MVNAGMLGESTCRDGTMADERQHLAGHHVFTAIFQDVFVKVREKDLALCKYVSIHASLDEPPTIKAASGSSPRSGGAAVRVIRAECIVPPEGIRRVRE